MSHYILFRWLLQNDGLHKSGGKAIDCSFFKAKNKERMEAKKTIVCETTL